MRRRRRNGDAAARYADAARRAQCTLALGRLNEHSASLFAAVAPQHARLAAQLAALNLRPLPPLAPSSSRAWLGARSNLY